MKTYDEFPIPTVAYNLAMLSGLIALGLAAAAQFGVWALLAYVLLLVIAVVGNMGTVCARCEGYYGRRCGMGLGKVASLLFRQGQTGLFLRTPEQHIITGLLLVAFFWPIVGSAIVLVRGFSLVRLLQLAAAVALFLAFILPHPRLVCRHCHQGACGACLLGHRLAR